MGAYPGVGTCPGHYSMCKCSTVCTKTHVHTYLSLCLFLSLSLSLSLSLLLLTHSPRFLPPALHMAVQLGHMNCVRVLLDESNVSLRSINIK